MVNIENKTVDLEKLVDNIPLTTLEDPIPGKRLTKKRVRRIAEPHIRPHTVKGKVYYTYCRGTDKEFYLGNADAILNAVRNVHSGTLRKTVMD